MESNNFKKTPKWVIALAIIVGIISILGPIIFIIVLFSFDRTSKFDIRNDGTININDEELVVNKDINGYYDEKTNSYYIEGYLKNNENEDYEYVYITFNVYDENNNILGEATADLSHLEKKGTWKFKAAYSSVDSKDVAKFKLTDVEAEDYDDFD